MNILIIIILTKIFSKIKPNILILKKLLDVQALFSMLSANHLLIIATINNKIKV
jgi:hypothetical protein